MTQPSYHPAPSAPLDGRTVTAALACPRCAAPAVPSTTPQRCGRCAGKFTLSAGAALDSSVVPPPFHPAAPRIQLKWSIVVTYQFAALDALGVSYGTLDPVVGIAPIEQHGIGYVDVVSIAVWRKLALPDCIAGILVPLPIALFAAYGAILAAAKSAGVAAVLGAVAIGFGLLAWLLLHRGFKIGRRQARITGRWQSFTVPFERSPAFYAELFRRCGLAAPPVP